MDGTNVVVAGREMLTLCLVTGIESADILTPKVVEKVFQWQFLRGKNPVLAYANVFVSGNADTLTQPLQISVGWNIRAASIWAEAHYAKRRLNLRNFKLRRHVSRSFCRRMQLSFHPGLFREKLGKTGEVG